MKLTEAQRESLAHATRHYHQWVADAKDYLLGRGITGEMARDEWLGYVREPLPGHEPYVGRLVIPYVSVAGPVDIRFRAVEPEVKPKYLSLPGAHARLYGARTLAVGGQTAAVCEGECDQMILHHYLQIPAVGVPGAQQWSANKHWPRCLAGFSRVLMFADPDEAGRDLAKQVARDVPNVTIVNLDHDVTDTLMKQGVETLRERAGL